jgi:hypothetical protein
VFYIAPALENLTSPSEITQAPFTMPEIQQYVDFIKFSNEPLLDGGVPIAKTIIISNILAIFCAFMLWLSS